MQKAPLIDTHAHLEILALGFEERELENADWQKICEAQRQADKASVTTLINVATTLHTSALSIQIAQQLRNIYATVGIHPNDITSDWITQLQGLQRLLDGNGREVIVGIGECGMDAYRSSDTLSQQYQAFCAQIELALAYNLPLIVHTRNAGELTLKALNRYKNQHLKGIIHCFSEDLSFAQTAIECGFLLGIGGTVTYPKNDQLRTIVKTVGLANIVLETDTPFLPPQGWRGTPNYPAHIATIAHYLAQLLDTHVNTIAKQTTRNAENLFGITAAACATNENQGLSETLPPL